MTVAIVDNGGANMSSLMFALERLGVKSVLSCQHTDMEAATHIILPGVGHAKDSMQRLHQSNLVEYLRTTDKPVLGICLGMQLLYAHSEEGTTPCLGIVPGTVARMPPSIEQPSPHMGWNQIEHTSTHPLLHNIPSGSYMYFVHSYAAPVNQNAMAVTHYANPFASMVEHDNYLGMQFHPERSGTLGATLLANFVALS